MPEEDLIIEGEPIYYAWNLSPKFKELYILPFSDLHKGNPLCSEKHFLRDLSLLEKPNYYAVFNGDMIEAIIRSSVGDIYTQKNTPQAQAEWVTKKLKPYKKKILGMTMGNHEYRIYRDTSIDLCRIMAKDLGIPYRTEGLMLKVSFGDNNNRTEGKPYVYWVYLTHGYGGARTKSAKAVKVERTGNWIHADVYIMSHDHVVNVAPDVYLLPDPRTKAEKDKDGNETGFTIGSVKAHRKMLVKSNAYLKYGGYGEMGGFPPVDLEIPIIKFSGQGKTRVRVEV